MVWPHTCIPFIGSSDLFSKELLTIANLNCLKDLDIVPFLAKWCILMLHADLNIGYAITTMSKFSTKPSKYHYELLKGIEKYLWETKDWEIKFTQSVVQNDLAPTTLKSDVVLDENLPPFPVDFNQPKLLAFVNAAYTNDQQKRWSTTGSVFTYCGGAIVYHSKTQTVTAISSTEAEFIAAVSCAKIALYLWSILYELGFACIGPTPIYKDNASTIDIVNSSVPTEHAWHIYIQYFAIQDW